MVKTRTPFPGKHQHIPINKALVWDYDIPDDKEKNESFLCWYIQRVLSKGSAADLRDIGLETISFYFPKLQLPPHIQEFWEWYFNLEEIRQKYGNINAIPDSTP
ncbi:MAG: hypothetical protein WAM60_11225 [Candidatus Promineifilaceae bacterium]